MPCDPAKENSLSSSHALCFPNSLLSVFPPSGMSSCHQLPVTLNQNDLSQNSITKAILLVYIPILVAFSLMALLVFPWFSCFYCYVCRVFAVCLALFMNILSHGSLYIPLKARLPFTPFLSPST